LLLTSAVWLALAATAWLSTSVRHPLVSVLGFSIATLLVLAARESALWPRRAVPRSAGLFAAAAGFTGIAAAQILLFERGANAWGPFGIPGKSSLGIDAFVPWLLLVLLGSVFEEVLYREQVLGAMRASGSTWAAAPGSSLLYALPHGDPLAVVGAFGFGLLLAWTMLRTGSLRLCLCLHAGANLAWLAGYWICATVGLSHALAFTSGAIAVAALAAMLRCAGSEAASSTNSRRLEAKGGWI
jgi:membrane protease YdiL (CAAX protease family)